jgi:hypothetical protein
MKNITLVVLLSLLSIAKADAKVRVYIGIGQSNMEGAVKAETIDSLGINDRIWHIPTCQFDGKDRVKWAPRKAVPPLHHGLCPLDYFGRVIAEEFKNDTIVLINVSVGGTKIQLFDKDSCDAYAHREDHPSWFKSFLSEYDFQPRQRLIEAARYAQKQGWEICAILLHQGESNTGEVTWPKMVKKVYKDLLADLKLKEKDVPLIAGEVVSKEDDGASGEYMNPIIDTLPKVIKNCAVVSSLGLPVYRGDGMNVHFQLVGMRTFGMRYAEAYLKLINKR